MRATLVRTFQFDAAHRNLTPGADEKTARMHGHTYEVTVSVYGDVDEQMGWLLDFGDIKSAATAVIDVLDHHCLNDVEGLASTTTDDLTRWLNARLDGMWPGETGYGVRVVGSTEFAPSVQRATAAHSAERIAFGFAAAHFLPRLPDTHKCRRLHGHSYQIEIATPDASDLLPRLADLYPEIDHRLLNDIPGLENPTSEILAQWLWDKLDGNHCGCSEVVVSETCATSCIFRGGE